MDRLVEAELRESDSFDSVLRGKVRRRSQYSLIWESDKAKSCWSQLCSGNYYPEPDFLKKWKVERGHVRLGNFWGVARKGIVPRRAFSHVFFCLQPFWRLVLKEEVS